IQAPSDANLKASHPPRERRSVVRLDEKMQVVGLDGVVHHSKVRPAKGRAECPTKNSKSLLHAQRRNIPSHPKRDVNGVPSQELRPRSMRNKAPWSRSTTGPTTSPTPSPHLQGKRKL